MKSAFILFCAAAVHLLILVQSQHASIFLELDRNLRPGDEIVIEGKMLGRPSVTRFFSSSTICSSKIPKINTKHPRCQPLIILMRPRVRRIDIFFKGADSNYRDQLLTKITDQPIGRNQPYRLIVEVLRQSYKLTLNGVEIAVIDDQVGHSEINAVRSYNGDFKEFYIAYNQPASTRNSDICGTRPALSTVTPRIVGGTNARKGEFPWQAALRRKYTSTWVNYKHLCGGTVIQSCWIITAAHCVERVQGSRMSNYVFRVGDYYNGEDEANTQYQSREEERDFEIAEVIIHSNYSTDPTPRNDIALVRLQPITNSQTCIPFSRMVRPACLPRPEQDFPPKTPCIITGWGALNWTDRPSDFPGILQKAEINIDDYADCKAKYNGTDKYGNPDLAPKTLCASAKGRDTCQGDSGGPLVCVDSFEAKGTHFTLWGVTSWGDGCAKANKPGIYTKVIDFMDWISAIISP